MESNHPPLGRDVLRDVSRSFYLSLRLLSSGFRDPAGLGYLLARLSDTIADAGTLETQTRQRLLSRFGDLAAALPNTGGVAAYAERLDEALAPAGLPAGERRLVARSAEVFQAASLLTEENLGPLRSVIATIVQGQCWDLTRFAGADCVVLERESELEEYADRVAGCVGEFWTDLAFANTENPASADRTDMVNWGHQYGQGLQLVNILRDVPEDLRRGRCYLPGADPLDRDDLMERAARWRVRARSWLQAGLRYTDALRGMRLKIASGLPALLGLQTLDLLENTGWEQWEEGVKVTRRDVKKALARAVALSSPVLPGRWVP